MSESLIQVACNHFLDKDEAFCVRCGKRFKYDNGLPFSDIIAHNLDDLKERIRLNKASLLIVDGGVGEGKTTLAVHCADYFQGSPILFASQLGSGGAEFQEKMQICIDSQLIVIIYDEAGDFNSRGALTKFNQMLNRLFETFRTFRILVILTLPNVGDLDDSLFKKQIPRILLHCHGRNEKYGEVSGYSLHAMYWLRDKIKKSIVKPHAYNQQSPNFRGHFLDLSPRRSAELEKYSSEAKMGILTENIIRNRGLVSVKDLSRRLQRSPRWVIEKIRKHNLNFKQVFKRAKYYDNDVIGMLEAEKQG